jgi:tetratricopeptide (TPR) repeat protein
VSAAATDSYRFEIALSFAGDNKRDKVRTVAEILRDELGEGRVFFDEWFEHELAGHDAHVVLQNVYRRQTRVVVTCVCQRYSEKPWTQEEWRAIQALERECRDAGAENVRRLRIIPLRFGDGEVDGLYETAIVPDVRTREPRAIADLILKRLRSARGEPSFDGGGRAPVPPLAQPPSSSGEPANRERPAPGMPSPQRWVHETTEDARYTGRENLLQTLDRWADESVVRTIAITGMGGLGKTALLGRWLKQHGGTDRRPNRGLFFWSFYAENNVGVFLESFVRFTVNELRLIELADMDLVRRAIHAFNTVPLVVVLDGLELLQELPDSRTYGRITNPSLQRFLVATCSSPQRGLVLLTSRFPFADLTPYTGRAFRCLTLEQLTPAEGASLLQTSGVAGTSLMRENIAGRLEGHPLALRIFAAALATQSEGDPTRFWDLVFDQAKLDLGDRLEQKLGRLLAFYERYLPPVRVALMGIISMFRYSIEATTVLWLGSNLEVTRTVVEVLSDVELRAELFGIIDDGLLIRERGPGDRDLLTCHPLLRDHFRASLLQRDGRVAAEVAAILTDRPSADVYTTLSEVEPFLNAIELLLAVMDIGNAWALYRQRLERGSVLQRMLATTEGLRCALSFIAALTRNPDADKVREAHHLNSIVRGPPVRLALAEWHYHAGVFSALAGELTNAETHLDDASHVYTIDADEITGGSHMHAQILEQHAEVLASLGRLFDAAHVARRSIAVCGSPSLFGITRRVHTRLAVILVSLGQLTDAIKVYSNPQDYRFNVHDEEDFRIGLLLNDLKLKLGEAQEVCDNLGGLQMLFENRGWSIDLARSYLFRARAAIELGQVLEAETWLETAEELASRGHAFGMLAELLLARSTLERARGNHAGAIDAAEAMLQIAAPRQMRLHHIDALVARGRAVLARTAIPAGVSNDDVSRVVDDAEAALRMARGCGYIWAERDALVLLADARYYRGDTALAASLRADADAIARKLNASAKMPTVHPRRRAPRSTAD